MAEIRNHIDETHLGCETEKEETIYWSGYDDGKSYAVHRCAEIITSMTNICQINCPVKCEWSTDEDCIKNWEAYLADKIKEK